MAQSVFGAGFLFGIPQGANPTPVKFARLQDVATDFSYENKQLWGSQQYPVENARGKAKIDLKATTGVIDPALFNQIYFGLTLTTGETLNSVQEQATPSAGNFTVANSATFSTDLGIYDTVAHQYLQRVASAPSAGQYAVSAGVYTVNTGANGHLMLVDYTYASASTGQSLAFTNQPMGTNVVFRCTLVNKFKGSDGIVRSMYLNFPAVQANKLSMPAKLDDYTLPQFDMTVQDDGAGNIFNYSMTGG